MAEEFFIIDGHAQIHRAYHAPFQNLTGPPGSCSWCNPFDDKRKSKKEVCPACMGETREPTKATYLFTQMLIRLVKERKPSYLAVAVDGYRENLLRRKISPTYKAHRKDVDPSLRVQLMRCRSITAALGIPVLEVKGYEADDILATLATRCVSDDVHIRLVTRDKDMASLLSDPRVKFYDPQAREELGADWVKQHFKVNPKQMEDYLSIVGDTTDGIKGVCGVGDKGAVKLLRQHGSIDKMLQSNLFKCSTDKASQCVRAAVKDGSLELARQLVRLEKKVPIKIRSKALECDGLTLKRAAPLFKILGFRRWE